MKYAIEQQYKNLNDLWIGIWDSLVRRCHAMLGNEATLVNRDDIPVLDRPEQSSDLNLFKKH